MDSLNNIENIDIIDLNNLLIKISDTLKEDKTGLALKRVLQFVFDIIKYNNVNLSLEIFEKLLTAIIESSNTNNADASAPDYGQQFVTNPLDSVHLQVTKFPTAERKYILEELWLLSVKTDRVHPLAGQFLVNLFDDFVRELGLEMCPQLLMVIQELLQSKKATDRQSAYILMHKLEDIFDSNTDIAGAIKCTKQQWTDYIDVVEHLEEQKMPSKLFSFFDNMISNYDFTPWIYLLYKRSLKSDNIFVTYKTVKYIVANLNIYQLTDWDLMEDFLAATNRTQLYNVDDDDRSNRHFEKFISTKEKREAIAALVNVSWEWNSVPLFEWLTCIPKEEKWDLPSISKEIFFQLCSVVIGMKNLKLREVAINRVIDLFQSTIKELCLGDYLILIYMMYKNRDEHCSDHSRSNRQLVVCNNFDKQISFFIPLCLDIRFKYSNESLKTIIIAIVKKLRKLPPPQHGWFRLLIVCGILFETMDEVHNFCSSKYGVDINLIQNGKDLKAIQDHLIDKLMCETSEEKSNVLELSVDIFIYTRIKKWSEIEEFQLNPVELLKQGGWQTIRHLAYLLSKCEERLEDENVLPAFLASLKKYPCFYAAKDITGYASNHLTTEEQNILSVDIIKNHIHTNENLVYLIIMTGFKINIDQVLREILHNLPISEDAWIETTYNNFYGIDIIFDCFTQHAFWHPDYYGKEVVEDLLRINRELSESHPHYLNNSKEHRLKFYIAETLLILSKKIKCSDDQLWPILFSQNEQFNITCMYELIVANTLTSFDPILERLQWTSTLEPNQQMSLLSVTNICLHHKSKMLNVKQQQMLFALLITLGMNDELQVRQFAKYILNRLIAIFKEKRHNVPLHNSWQTGLERDLGSMMCGPQLQAHLILRELYLDDFSEYGASKNFKYLWYIFYISNIQPIAFRNNNHVKFRRALRSISLEYPKSNASDNDLVIVAALMDDLTSLNELIRTCKALRVRTLILSNSTSLTTIKEDSLNIIKMNSDSLNQYLSEKKLRNYNIVATKKAGESADFIKFSFAKKTILLIGHEQNGIPENLMHLVDKTVELPQTNYQEAQNLLVLVYLKQYFTFR